MTAGRCNVYYHSVKGSVKLCDKFSLTVHSTRDIGFFSETGSSTVAIFDAFRTTRRPYVARNTTHLWGRVEKSTRYTLVLIGTRKGNATACQ